MPKILIVDDERISLALVKFGLKAEDYEVITARDGEEGLKKVKKEKPDLIVLDIMMPNINGYEFMGELKQLEIEKIPPVFILTAHKKLKDVFKMENIQGYFVKPVNMTLFVSEIKACLESSSS
ncbi:MAG TPA: response regulator [Candidatus Omnitrophota bacterium]|nr:response regulator [Candidatus Omnitrophota bacterium]